MFPTSIRYQLLLWIGLPIIVIYGLVVTIRMQSDIEWIRKQTLAMLREKTALHAAECESVFTKAAGVAHSLANFTIAARPKTKQDIFAFIKTTLDGNDLILGSTLAYEPQQFDPAIDRFAFYVYRNITGTVLGDTPLSACHLHEKDLAHGYESDYLDWAWYATPKAQQTASWSEPYYDDGGGNVQMCTYSVPFSFAGEPDSVFAGVATVDIPLDEIKKIITSIESGDAHYLLVSAKRAVIATTSSDTTNTDERIWRIEAPIPSTNWSLTAIVSERAMLRPIYDRLYTNMLISLLGLLVLVAVLVQVSRRITRPVERLAKFARELASGNLNASVGDVHTTNEIGQLARTFETMVGDLKRNVNERITQEAARKAVETELQVARRIQTSLMPHTFPPIPHREEFDLFAINEPAKYMAGDFYDFFDIDESRRALVIADVSGKGVPAAMFMAVTRTAIRNLTTFISSPADIITHLNAILSADNPDSMFVTLFYGHYDINTGELVYVNAGHNPPYVLRHSEQIDTLEATGPLTAAFDGATYTQEMTRLEKGESLVLFTDGVTEAHQEGVDILFGEQRLVELLSRIQNESAEAMCQQIVSETLAFSAGERHDDITLLVLKRQE